MMLTNLNTFDTLTVAVLKTLDLSDEDLSVLRDVIDALRVIAVDSYGLVTPEHRRQLNKDGQRALEALTDEQKLRILAKQSPNVAIPTGGSNEVSDYVYRLLREDAKEEEFDVGLWQARSAYFSTISDSKCSGCERKDALRKVSAAVRDFVLKNN